MENNYNVKEVLTQLSDLKQEYKDKQEAIERLRKHIERLEKDGYVERDSVTGGNGGKQHFVIEGFPYPIYTQKKTQLLERKMQLELIREKIGEQIAAAEKAINSAKNSRIRRLLTYRYIYDLTWVQIAHRMGGKHTEDSCKKAVQRFLQEK